jgi:hypothetical protein
VEGRLRPFNIEPQSLSVITPATKVQPVLAGHPATLFDGSSVAPVPPALNSPQSKEELEQAETTLIP